MESPTLKQRLFAYKKVAGIFIPTPLVWRPFGTLLELDRCNADGRLVSMSPSVLDVHQGHGMKGPVLLSVWEMFLVWIRWIR